MVLTCMPVSIPESKAKCKHVLLHEKRHTPAFPLDT